MSESKLMKPLFHGYHFNKNGIKKRAVFCREVSNGKDTYRLWRSAGKPDVAYPRTENDTYRLHIELNGYLIPLYQKICSAILNKRWKMYGRPSNAVNIKIESSSAD